MKSEQRHELQKNELSKAADNVVVLYDRYKNQILWGVVVLLMGLSGWIYFARSSRISAESAWTSVQMARNPEEYLDVSIRFPHSSAGNLSKLQAALAWLDMGVRTGFTNREQSILHLKDARREFEELVAQPQIDKSMKEQALFGLGQTLESISGSDTEAAINTYKQLLEEFPDSLFKERVEERISDLKSPATQDFLAWYQKQNPKPPEPEKPKDGQAPGADSAAPKPSGDASGLGIPAPPQIDGGAPTDNPATSSPNDPLPTSGDQQDGQVEKGAEKQAEPEEPKGPALPTEAPSGETNSGEAK